MTSTDGYWITAAVLSGNENKSMQRSCVPNRSTKTLSSVVPTAML